MSRGCADPSTAWTFGLGPAPREEKAIMEKAKELFCWRALGTTRGHKKAALVSPKQSMTRNLRKEQTSPLCGTIWPYCNIGSKEHRTFGTRGRLNQTRHIIIERKSSVTYTETAPEAEGTRGQDRGAELDSKEVQGGRQERR